MSSNIDTDAEWQPKDLLDAVEHLEAVAFVPSKQRYTDAGKLAKTIASYAYEDGIPPAGLNSLINILTKNNALDQSTITTLAKNLYPLGKVPSKLVTRVVSCLGPSKNKPSTATQALLLKWLILVYDYLEDRNHLFKLYAALFNFLDMISLRKSLCHLLSIITRRKHVKPFRIQAVMELLRNSGGDEKELLGLLRVFKNYYPDIIVGDLGGLRRTGGFFFKHPDPEWPDHMKHLQEKNAQRSAESQPSSFQVVRRGGFKRSKIEVVIPSMQTSRVSRNHTSLEELRGISHFVEKLDKIELPNQIISALGDGLGQKYLSLVQSELANQRLEDWLEGFLNDKLESIRDDADDDPETLTYVLTLAVDYARLLKETPAALLSFLKLYLPLWNGKDNRDQVFGLLEYLPIEPYESVRNNYFAPLEAAVLDDMLHSRAMLLDFYTSLIRQWGVKLRIWPSSFTSEEPKPLTHLISYAELLALSTLESPPIVNDSEDAEKTRPAVLSVIEFYSVLAELFSHASVNESIRLTIPLAPTVYSVAFTPISSLLSILASVLSVYKLSFEESLTSEVLQERLYPTELVGQFNGYVMDICNLVWRNRALNTEDADARGCLIPEMTVTALTQYVRDVNETARERKREFPFHYKLPLLFSVSHHVALCNFSAASFADFEDENDPNESRPRLRKPVTQKALNSLEKEGGVKITWQDYRVRMLDWLDGIGSHGIPSLMRSTMKALRKE